MRCCRTMHRTREGCWCLGVIVAAGAAVWTMAQTGARPEAEGRASEPGGRASAPGTPVFAKTQPAGNQTGLCLVLDDRKLLGWIAGKEGFAGREVTVTAGDRTSTVIVQRDNTFTWHYRVRRPEEAVFSIGGMKEAVTLRPVKAPEPTAFFVVDRTAYRPLQTMHFAAFLRQPDQRGEFVPLARRKVEVRLVSRKKKTTAVRLEVVSDDFGRVTGQYRFSEADPLDTYDLEVPGHKGSGEVTLAEFRKSKVRLKIDGVTDGPQVKLTFQAVDFLDQPVPGTKVRFTAQVVRDGRAKPKQALDPEQFVYHEATPIERVPAGSLPEEQRLLWEAGMLPAWAAVQGGPVVVAQHEADLAMNKEGYAEHTLALEEAWREGGCSVIVQGVLVDYNGREQRAARRIPIGPEDEKPGLEVVLGKRWFDPGEPIHLRLRTGQEGTGAAKPDAAVVAMRLSPTMAVPTAWGNYRGAMNQMEMMPGMMGDMGMQGPWNGRSLYASNGAFHGNVIRHSVLHGWRFYRPRAFGEVARSMVTATVARQGSATLTLDQPGPYKLVCVADLPDGRKLTGEAGTRGHSGAFSFTVADEPEKTAAK